MKEAKIMIVDDEPDISDLLEKSLNIEGFRNIIKADTGAAAINTCRETRPDMMILDVMLPDLDGYEVCRQIRQFSHCPILFLSSRNDELDKILGLAVGGDDMLPSPSAPERLLTGLKHSFVGWNIVKNPRMPARLPPHTAYRPRIRGT